MMMHLNRHCVEQIKLFSVKYNITQHSFTVPYVCKCKILTIVSKYERQNSKVIQQKQAMTEKKSQHIMTIQQTLAQFDIQTQVKRITLETMDAYMLGNKQAFAYIKQWESKIIEFQSRLFKAENYYKNIELNVNSKIEVTNSVNKRLEQFANEFWAGMKESTESVEQMRKNYMNLVKQTGIHANTLKSYQKDFLQVNNKADRLQSALLEQNVELNNKISRVDNQILLKNNQRRGEFESILQKFSLAKSELNSKSQLIAELCHDLELYKNEKISIKSQIATIHEELAQKVQLSQFNKIRVYIDNNVTELESRITQAKREVDNKINIEIRAREQDVSDVNKIVNENKIKLSADVQQTNKKFQSMFTELSDKLVKLNQKMEANFIYTERHIKQNSHKIQQNSSSILQILQKLQAINTDLEDKKNHIIEAESNILSINAQLKLIDQQNGRRVQQLAKIRSAADDKNNLGDQVQKMVQKLLLQEDTIIKLQESVLLLSRNLASQTSEIRQQHIKEFSIASSSIATLFSQLSEQSGRLNNKIEQKVQIIQKLIETKHALAIETFTTSLADKIDRIKDKFEFMASLSASMEQFKITFQEQLTMNDLLNKEIKQKMDRVFAMFTKLKSDSFTKIELLSQDISKNAGKLANTIKTISDITGVLSQFNEDITAILCVQLASEISQDPANNSSTQQQEQEYKLGSLIEGWVLEASRDRMKYRSDVTTRRSIVQLMLEEHVRSGDKIKGGLIENGKEIYNKMAGASEDYQGTRRRSLSRKKHRQSELPKVYK